MDRQARLEEGGFTFQQMLKPSVNPYLALRAERALTTVMSCY